MLLSDVSNKTILISALDWGGGHTTRCVSLIERLIKSGNRIIFAGNEEQNSFMKNEFKSIELEYLQGYEISLSSKQNTYFQIFRQLVKISRAIKNELLFVEQMVAKYNLDLILSDNRYGFRSKEVNSIFIGHQLNLELPFFKNWTNNVLSKLVNKFDRVWIVDDQTVNLSGRLSSTTRLNIPYDYIGFLARFQTEKRTKKYDYLIIISGPNPENGLFLKEIEKAIVRSKNSYVIVSKVKSEQKIKGVDYFYAPSTKMMNNLLNESEVIISKAGYTTLMELYSLGKKAILMPTHGQFEQEYLAKHIKEDVFTFIGDYSNLKGVLNS